LSSVQLVEKMATSGRLKDSEIGETVDGTG